MFRCARAPVCVCVFFSQRKYASSGLINRICHHICSAIPGNRGISVILTRVVSRAANKLRLHEIRYCVFCAISVILVDLYARYIYSRIPRVILHIHFSFFRFLFFHLDGVCQASGFSLLVQYFITLSRNSVPQRCSRRRETCLSVRFAYATSERR